MGRTCEQLILGHVTNSKMYSSSGIGPFQISDRDDIHRYGDCPVYLMCLDLAAQRRWPGFSCKGCFRYENKTSGDH